MKRQICKYSLIRFQPFAETEEFANVGIVLYLPETKALHFKLLSTKEHGRISQFFEPLNRNIFTHTIQIIEAELQRIQSLSLDSISMKVDFYEELIRSREDIIQYSKSRVLFSTDIVKTLDELFEHYVKRKFVYKEDYEKAMQKRIKDFLKKSGWEREFKNGSIGEEHKYKVQLPFVSRNAQVAIKPIHFRQADSNKLIDHGLTWRMKIQQLCRHGFIQSNHVLFAYDPPEDNRDSLLEAFTDVKSQIEESGIIMVDIKHFEQITDFLSHAI